jgi:hypothetical protein
VTQLQPQGDAVAETVAAVARRPRRSRRALAAAAVAVVVIASAGGWAWQQHRAEQARLALQEQIAQQTGAARELCAGGSFSASWPRFDELAARYPGSPIVLDARADCGMQWLREIRVQVGKQTFSDIVAMVRPALVDRLASATGARAADLRAHLGWADYLRWRDGAGDTDAVGHYRRALADDAANPYAHAMWGHRLMMAGEQSEAIRHFDAAVASGRERAFVRTLQLSSSVSRVGLVSYAVKVADDMRRSGETMAAGLRAQLWRMGYYALLFNGGAEARRDFLALLPPADHLATFDWLFPQAADVGSSEADIWQFCRAVLLAHAGQAVAARQILESIRSRREAAKEDGLLLDETRRQLAAMK